MSTEPKTEPKQVAWGPIKAVLISLLLFFGCQILLSIILVGVLTLLGWDLNRIEEWLSSGNTPQFVLNAATYGLMICILFTYLSSIKAHPRDLGLVRPKWRDVGYVMLGAGVYIVSYVILVAVISKLVPGLDTEQTQELGFSAETVGNELILIFVSLVVIPPIVEEIIVRGFLFTGLRTRLSFLVAAVISSALFGLAHLLGGEGGSTIWIATIDTFILGMVLAYLREKTGSLWSPIGLHALKNFIAFMALFVFKVA